MHPTTGRGGMEGWVHQGSVVASLHRPNRHAASSSVGDILAEAECGSETFPKTQPQQCTRQRLHHPPLVTVWAALLV
eukprot:178965-Chlamydomonas_euryale.AAC.2